MSQSFTGKSNQLSLVNQHSASATRLNKSLKFGSLNYIRRKQEVNSINQSNKQLLRALQNVRPVIKRDWNHEARIRKLREHIGMVRYKDEQNFVFPATDNENHNFHSSQFLFLKSPAMINITPNSKKRSDNNFSRS